MLDAAESVLVADLTTPLAERAVVYLDDRAAVAADQVVVMAMGAGTIGRLAVRTANRVDLVVLFEAAEVAVDRGEADLVESLVELLRGQGAVALLQLLDDRRALDCRAAGAGAVVL